MNTPIQDLIQCLELVNMRCPKSETTAGISAAITIAKAHLYQEQQEIEIAYHNGRANTQMVIHIFAGEYFEGRYKQ